MVEYTAANQWVNAAQSVTWNDSKKTALIGQEGKKRNVEKTKKSEAKRT